MMADYFLTAPNEATMAAVLRGVWETNNPPLPDGALPPEYSEQGWVLRGFTWTLVQGQMDASGQVSVAPEYKPGYHAALRVHGGELGPISLGLLAGAGIAIVEASTVQNPPIMWV